MAWLSIKQRGNKLINCRWLIIELIQLLCLIHMCSSSGILSRLRTNEETMSLPQYPAYHNKKCNTPACRSEGIISHN